jgi:hypothetical protein
LKDFLSDLSQTSEQKDQVTFLVKIGYEINEDTTVLSVKDSSALPKSKEELVSDLRDVIKINQGEFKKISAGTVEKSFNFLTNELNEAIDDSDITHVTHILNDIQGLLKTYRNLYHKYFGLNKAYTFNNVVLRKIKRDLIFSFREAYRKGSERACLEILYKTTTMLQESIRELDSTFFDEFKELYLQMFRSSLSIESEESFYEFKTILLRQFKNICQELKKLYALSENITKEFNAILEYNLMIFSELFVESFKNSQVSLLEDLVQWNPNKMIFGTTVDTHKIQFQEYMRSASTLDISKDKFEDDKNKLFSGLRYTLHAMLIKSYVEGDLSTDFFKEYYDQILSDTDSLKIINRLIVLFERAINHASRIGDILKKRLGPEFSMFNSAGKPVKWKEDLLPKAFLLSSLLSTDFEDNNDILSSMMAGEEVEMRRYIDRLKKEIRNFLNTDVADSITNTFDNLDLEARMQELKTMI